MLFSATPCLLLVSSSAVVAISCCLLNALSVSLTGRYRRVGRLPSSSSNHSGILAIKAQLKMSNGSGGQNKLKCLARKQSCDRYHLSKKEPIVYSVVVRKHRTRLCQSQSMILKSQIWSHRCRRVARRDSWSWRSIGTRDEHQ